MARISMASSYPNVLDMAGRLVVWEGEFSEQRRLGRSLHRCVERLSVILDRSAIRIHYTS